MNKNPEKEIKKIAIKILKKYKKTFIDLAKK